MVHVAVNEGYRVYHHRREELLLVGMTGSSLCPQGGRENACVCVSVGIRPSVCLCLCWTRPASGRQFLQGGFSLPDLLSVGSQRDEDRKRRVE